MAGATPPRFPLRLVTDSPHGHAFATPRVESPQNRPQSASRSPSTANPSPLMSRPPPSHYANQASESAEPPTRRPGVRGPGKKEPREKPIVSVRWEEADLSERLITAIYENERWSGVFGQAPIAAGEGARSGLVPKRDLHREIARHLFSGDARYDLEDRKVVEALAVSVKNKLFKIQTSYNDARQEMGDLPHLPTNLDAQHGTPEQVSMWSYVSERFPQFFRIRDIMARVPASLAKEEPRSPEAMKPEDTSGPSRGSGQGLKRKARQSFEDMPAAGSRSGPFRGQAASSSQDMGGPPSSHRPQSFLSPSPPPETPSLTQTLGLLIRQIDDRGRREERRRDEYRQRLYEKELEENDKQREHDREMMKLRIKLAQAERGRLSRVSGDEELEEMEEYGGSDDAEGEQDVTYLPRDPMRLS